MSTRGEPSPVSRSGVRSALYLASATCSCPASSDPSACTTRHQATPPPHSAITRPTCLGPPSPRYSATSPYDMTLPGAIESTTSRTRAAYPSGPSELTAEGWGSRRPWPMVAAVSRARVSCRRLRLVTGHRPAGRGSAGLRRAAHRPATHRRASRRRASNRRATLRRATMRRTTLRRATRRQANLRRLRRPWPAQLTCTAGLAWTRRNGRRRIALREQPARRGCDNGQAGRAEQAVQNEASRATRRHRRGRNASQPAAEVTRQRHPRGRRSCPGQLARRGQRASGIDHAEPDLVVIAARRPGARCGAAGDG